MVRPEADQRVAVFRGPAFRSDLFGLGYPKNGPKNKSQINQSGVASSVTFMVIAAWQPVGLLNVYCDRMVVRITRSIAIGSSRP